MMRIDPDGRTRFCDSCERPVYDSAAMTRHELADLIAWHEGRRLPCVRLHRRPDGTIVTRDCFAPVLRVGRFFALKVALAAAVFWGWVLGLCPLVRLPKRDDAPPISSEEITLARTLASEQMQGILSITRSAPPSPDASLLARTPWSNGWSLLPGPDRAPPLRTLEAEEEIWNPGGRR